MTNNELAIELVERIGKDPEETFVFKQAALLLLKKQNGREPEEATVGGSART